jgi:EAL and modified HD-GYP domain-containing signal transduction protein
MELLVSKLKPLPEIDDLEDAAFMIGTFSLLDVLLNMPIKEILQHLPLSETVSNALAEYAGGLGQLLAAINAAENRELELAVKRIERLAITGEDYRDAQLTSLSWAANIRPAG